MALSDYKKKPLHQQILDEPDTFVGGCDLIEDVLPIVEDNHIVTKTCQYVPAVNKLFDEILVNARDQITRLRESKESTIIHTTEIKVSYDEELQQWTVYNNGNGIDVAVHPTEKTPDGKPQYIVEMILGELLTSKNYNKRGKTTGGKNGFGAKLTNLFSQVFRVETVDHVRGLKYVQEFRNNMSERSKPKITKTKVKPYTKISWITDVSKFGIDSFTPNMIQYMVRRVYDIAGTTDSSIKVYYQSQKIPVKTFVDYCDLYLKDQARVCETLSDRWTVCVSVSQTDKFEHYSFVNGIYTLKGGKHVDVISKQITSKLVAMIEKRHKKTVPESYVKNYMKLFLNCVIEDPSFDSQSKERLITAPSKFGSKPELSDKFIKSIFDKLDLVQKVESFADFKTNKESKKTDGSKKNKIQVPKLDDANWAGTKKSNQCTLILTEGDSAKTMAISGLSVVGRDCYGVFPLRGKVLNVKEASVKQITDNTEITHLKKILGLESGRVYDSTDKLRYGQIMIMTDQDHDGSHIKGLVMLIFETLWPSLLKLGYVKSMITPIVKATWKKQVVCFYNLTDYETWKQSTPNLKQYKLKYYKGLGTSTAKEAREYFQLMKLTHYDFNEQTTDKMNLAFKRDCSNLRKDWLYQYNPQLILNNDQTHVGIDEFIDKELIHFSNSDTRRSIGSLLDGLKPSQRKILYCCFKRKLTSEIRVAQLAGYVSEHAAYHHGEASLQSTIIGMAQTFVGSNNIHLLKPNGQFGSRIMGGADSASPRYIHTELNPLVKYIYPPSDFPLLKREDDDGILVEPTYYVPILPMVLVNGMKGIGTGFSTDIPQYNPQDILDNLKRKLNSEDYKPMIPWYRGFRGKIQKISPTKFITKGTYDIIGKDKIVITELPIGMWTSNYKEFLDSVTVDKRDKKAKGKFVLDYQDHSTDETVKFIIHMNSQVSQYVIYNEKIHMDSIEKMFKLTTTKSISNIHLYNEKGTIQRYKTIDSILDEYYLVRYELYKQRKHYQLQDLDRLITIESSKLRFIDFVIQDKIVVYKNTQANVIEKLQHYKFPYIVNGIIETEFKSQSYHYLTTIPIRDFTNDKLLELRQRVDSLNDQKKHLQSQSIETLWLQELLALEQMI